ncbi:MAG: phosphonopyruvate decarboxylase [Candidatus Pelagibacter sp. TMED64]|nr:phosphonopyruvate decarboxylase [Candidatus Pelagibacter sp.]OUU66353.1 MAG: phosphonopyruvate decarboxylase [Candidatus Pelagibacter sp. TMED64]|tara:strand:- start:2733 stop:3833 length:1101 start_codon:yes stop_codon:yes gene_type:complete
MIAAKNFSNTLLKENINFITGVPDSVLKNMIFSFDKNKKFKHMPANNEGTAVALAIGHNLSTKKMAAVYFQNSGLGNAINPLISIAHQKVYSIPMVLIIGWRGSPNKPVDEPQHSVKGKITKQILKLLNIKYCIIRKKKDLNKLKDLIKLSKKNKKPVACLVEKGTLENQSNKNKKKSKKKYLLRHEIILDLLNKIKPSTKIISTTGYTSRELYQLRNTYNISKGSDFYMVGGMGHSAMVSVGVALSTRNEIICLDGDGSILMHLGSLSLIRGSNNKNFKHILLNNSSHESVGGQKTPANKINFKLLTSSLGYKNYFFASNKKNYNTNINKFLKSKGPSFFEIRIEEGSIKNLLRPNNLKKIKNKF